MFRFFKNKQDPAHILDDGQWVLMEGEYDGKPILVIINTNLRSFAGKTEHTLKIGFAIPLNNLNLSEMPDPEENEAIGYIEDRITDELNFKSSAVQALVNSALKGRYIKIRT